MKHYADWRINLAVFAGFILIVVGYFSYQNKQAIREFQKHSQEHSEILAAVVELNIRNAILAKDGLENIVSESLANSGRFIDYLDAVESFSSAELTAFALESGFSGLKIFTSYSEVSGPNDWLPGVACSDAGTLKHLQDKQLYLYSFAGLADDSIAKCVLIGLPAEKIEQTLADISVQRLLEMFNNLHDISYVRLGPSGKQNPKPSNDVTETFLPMGEEQLVVALKNTRFGLRRSQMQREFILFISFLILCGGVSSWWLYRAQQQRLQQTREFEQKMARQHEDAALGRAAATITHELRNPLNAIGMGLQRMQIESKSLDNEHKELLHSMRESVQRSNTIITRLKQYSDSFTVAGNSVNIHDLLAEVLKLYQTQSEKQQISIQFDGDEDLTVKGDKVLLAQLFENLIKNSIEAQSTNGFITIHCHSHKDSCDIEIVNGGFTLSEEESQLILEPYFTSKSRGTGLGLVISKKIVQAHGGEIDYRINFDKQIIQFNITLPLTSS